MMLFMALSTSGLWVLLVAVPDSQEVDWEQLLYLVSGNILGLTELNHW